MTVDGGEAIGNESDEIEEKNKLLNEMNYDVLRPRKFC